MTRGSTPATALPTNAPSGSTPSSRARSSLAITSAAAPSLIPLELPAVTVPPSRNAGLSAASFSTLVSGRGCSSRVTSPTGTSSSSKRPAVVRRRPALLRLERERVLLLARDAVALGHVLARLAHRLEREHRLQPRVGEAPAERRVADGLVAARERRAPACAITSGARDIDSTPPATNRSPSPATTAWHAPTRPRRGPDAQSRFTRDAGDRLRQAREQRGHARDVAVVLARLVGGSRSRRPRSPRAGRRRARPPRRSPPPRGRRAARPKARRRNVRPACAPRRGRPREPCRQPIRRASAQAGSRSRSPATESSSHSAPSTAATPFANSRLVGATDERTEPSAAMRSTPPATGSPLGSAAAS